eukprot:TRINITY_DN4973_c3_g1_i1.p1 TRINITY_DN4973_c3_g1~~TRINITY_DN4973_c3_g1_i1.p1  ORF type:complete len:579 (+),score=141.10 TRINITY_DN4973_c3_g1_i1:102-1838(+)
MRTWPSNTLLIVHSLLVALLLGFSQCLTSSLVGAGHEYHGGHPAVHITALARSKRKRAGASPAEVAVAVPPAGSSGSAGEAPLQPRRKGREAAQPALKPEVDVEVNGRGAAWNKYSNLTTELHDMKSEYTGEIGVGTNKDGAALFKAKVVFDTGSTNLWVASVLCQLPPCDHERSNDFYDPARSTTEKAYENRGDDIDIQFGTGELKGPLHIDTYRVGPMTVKDQPFAMIREMTGDVFSSFDFEGILGLAFKSLSFGGIEPFFERVIGQKLLEHNEFAFFFNTDSSLPSGLLWGGVDNDLFDGQITMVPVAQQHYWAVELLEFRIGDKVLGGTRHGNDLTKVIVDSGTTYFTAPTQLYQAVVDRIPDAPCESLQDHKPLAYVLRGANGEPFEISVTQETYMVGSISDASFCEAAFMSLDVSDEYGPALILGEVFMRHFFTVFSRGDGFNAVPKVGFAAARVGATPKVKAFELPVDGSAASPDAVTVEIDDAGATATKGTARAEQEPAIAAPVPEAAATPQPFTPGFVSTPRGARRYEPPAFEEGEPAEALAAASAAQAAGAKAPSSGTAALMRKDKSQ